MDGTEQQQTEKPADKITFTTPGGYQIVIKGFVSGGDMDELERVFLENITFDVDPDTGEVDQTKQSVPATVELDRTKKALELLVLSVDGQTEDVYKAVRDLPTADYDAIVDRVNEISVPLVKRPSRS